MEDARQQQLMRWLKTLPIAPNGHLQVVSGDASFRRYFRYLHGRTWYVAVDAPPPHESLQPFMAVAKAYRSAGINAPGIHACDEDNGFMVLDDFGDTLLFSRLADESEASAWYQQALSILPAIMRTTGTELGALPNYDEALLQRELSLFSDWLVQHHLGHELTSEQHEVWHNACELLIDNALQQPQVGVHRDFHSRNLMSVDNTNRALGVIDFQDAVKGPITYDAVSLLRDCYVQWPTELVSECIDFLHQRLQTERLLDNNVSRTLFQRWFDLMGIQRHLKAAGIFARLRHRDGKFGYMADVPRTLQYILQVSAKYDELKDFHIWVQAVEQALANETKREVTG